jgi:two-component system, LytTR family, response regulator
MIMDTTHYTAIIVNQESDTITGIQNLATDIPDLKIVAITYQATKVMSLCIRNRPDILFFDIDMPVMSGFEIMKEIHRHQLNPYVIFTTVSDQFAFNAIREGAFDYLIKPITHEELIRVMDKINKDRQIHNLEKRFDFLEKAVLNHRKLRFNSRSGLILIHPDEIFYIESDANYSEIFISKEQREVVSMNLSAMHEILPEQFIRISRSLIINSHYLTKLSGVNKRCSLKKGSEEIDFSIPEKKMPELKRRIWEE